MTTMLLGMAVSVIAAVGIVKFDSTLARMHAATKSASLGLSLVFIGAGVAAGSWALIGSAALTTVFLFATSPITGHMVGRAAYLSGHGGALVHDDLAGAVFRPLAVGPPSRDGFSALRWGLGVLVWMLLWRDVSTGTLIGGAVVAGLVEVVRQAYPRLTGLSLVGGADLLARFFGMVIASNARVAWEVVTPKDERVRQAIVAVPLSTSSVPIALLVANATSFTPGSLTIELTEAPLVLYVHVLHFTSTEEVQADVRRLEELVLRALPVRPPAHAEGD